MPALAHALWIWEIAELELGDLAIVAGVTGSQDMISRVAEWRSGGRVLSLTRSGPGTSDSPATMQRLSAAVAAAPGVAAVICDDSASLLELVLEAMPAWGRIVIATRTGNPATIDFYNNVHRKGCRIVTVPSSPAQIHDELWCEGARPHVVRAVRILRSRPSLVAPDK